jgi:hypothetical protein
MSPRRRKKLQIICAGLYGVDKAVDAAEHMFPFPPSSQVSPCSKWRISMLGVTTSKVLSRINFQILKKTLSTNIIGGRKQ